MKLPNTNENRLFAVFSWLIVLVLFGAVITWASVVIPVTLAVLFAVYTLCFVIGWTARLCVLTVRKVTSWFKRE